MSCQPDGGGDELWLEQQSFVPVLDSLLCKLDMLSTVYGDLQELNKT